MTFAIGCPSSCKAFFYSFDLAGLNFIYFFNFLNFNVLEFFITIGLKLREPLIGKVADIGGVIFGEICLSRLSSSSKELSIPVEIVNFEGLKSISFLSVCNSSVS